MTITTQAVPVGNAVRMEEVPDPQVGERAGRRSYSAKYKAAILAEYDGLDREGRGALMRREGLYSSLISELRKQRDKGALEALGKTKGRPPADPVERENVRLKAKVAKLESDLDTSRRVIDVQGKLSALLEQLATGGATDEDPAK
jgi:transposase-like protein